MLFFPPAETLGQVDTDNPGHGQMFFLGFSGDTDAGGGGILLTRTPPCQDIECGCAPQTQVSVLKIVTFVVPGRTLSVGPTHLQLLTEEPHPRVNEPRVPTSWAGLATEEKVEFEVMYPTPPGPQGPFRLWGGRMRLRWEPAPQDSTPKCSLKSHHPARVSEYLLLVLLGEQQS